MYIIHIHMYNDIDMNTYTGLGPLKGNVFSLGDYCGLSPTPQGPLCKHLVSDKGQWTSQKSDQKP